MNHLPILMELEARHYQHERLRQAEAERRRTQLNNVGDSSLKKSDPMLALTKRFAVAFVALFASASRLTR